MSDTYAKGDRVKVTLEGTVTGIVPFDDRVELCVEDDAGVRYFIAPRPGSVEKVEPEAEHETFGPGDVVRDLQYPDLVYTIGSSGYYSHKYDEWRRPGDPAHWKAGPFTSATHERVPVG